jgi:hypothetical protein
MSVQYYCNAVPRAEKVIFSISQHYMCEYSSQRPGEVIATDFTEGFITRELQRSLCSKQNILSCIKHFDAIA